MALAAGASIGPFQIAGQLGAGGMGEVYQARDTRLGRDVAIKILPENFSADPDRVARFTREARLASQLTHPNIVVLHEVGIAGPFHYLAMELVEGRTLRAWIESSKPPLSKRIAVAAEIVEGLAHAHRAGIVHRDLKPDNIMITAAGRAKILDFGIAKQLLERSTSAATVTNNATEPGVTIGTAPYMSPEQARGETVDYRSDQFAFGTILYEMLTGRHPFAKSSTLQTLSAIIELEVAPIETAALSLPAPLAWVVSRCLSKDPSDRYDSTADLARDLKTIYEHSSAIGGMPPAVRPRRRFLQFTALIATATVAILAGWMAGRLLSAPPGKVEAPTFKQLTFRRGLLQSARFTPDGSSIVFSGAWAGGPFELGMLHGLGPDAQKLSQPSAGIFAVSKDGQLAVSRDCSWVSAGQQCIGTLAVVPLGEGAPRNLLERVNSADWSPDGKALAAAALVEGGSQIQYPIGTVVYSSSRTLNHIRVSPDGNLIAFAEPSDGSSVNNVRIRVLDVKSREARTLSEGLRFPSGLAWSPDGHEVFYSDNNGDNRMAYISAVALTGEQRSVLQQESNTRLLDVARDGRVLVGRMDSQVDMWLRQNGTNTPLSWFDFTVAEAVSLDGRTVVFSERGIANQLLSYSLFVREIDGAGPVFLGEGRGMAISPDKKWVMANISRGNGTDYRLYPTGPGSARPVSVPSRSFYAYFTNDSASVVLALESGQTAIVPVSGGAARVLEHVNGAIDSPIAPDGDHFIAVDKVGHRRVASLRGAASPNHDIVINPGEVIRQWSEDGRSLFVQRNIGPGERRVERLELASGRRIPFDVIRPADQTGLVPGFTLIHMTRDARMMLVSFQRNFADLILVNGLK